MRKSQWYGRFDLGQRIGSSPKLCPWLCNPHVDIEVDVETGKVAILRFTAVQDVGTAIHPSYVEGQIQGGVVQGIGWGLNEEYVYDDEGHVSNASLPARLSDADFARFFP